MSKQCIRDPTAGVALFVLGMHRSGTSALTGLLHLLGFNLGNNLVPADPSINPRGYWENADLVDVHERALNSLGSSWGDDRNLPEQWWLKPEMDSFRAEIEAIVERDFPAGSRWAVKDPRLCRLLPLWQPVIENRGIKASAIVILRDPREVAKSLWERDGIASERACMLWLQHLIEAERWSRENGRSLIAYDDLLRNWRTVVGAVSKACGIDPLTPDHHLTARIEGFLSDELRHHRLLPEPSEPIEGLALHVYRNCLVSDEQCLAEQAQRASYEIEALLKSTAPWSTEIDMLRKSVISLKGDAERREQLSHEVDRIKNTFSWRITAPLRVMWNFWQSQLHRFSPDNAERVDR